MPTVPRLVVAPLIALALAVAPGCAGDPASPPDVAGHQGTLQVNLALSGSGSPPERVLLALDAGNPAPYDGAGPYTLGPLPEGSHAVRLGLPEARCWPTVSVDSGVVREDEVTALDLAAECDSIVPGPVTVRTTSDRAPFAARAELWLDGRSYGRVGVPGTRALPRVPSGDHRLTLALDSTTACAFQPDTTAFKLGREPATLVFALDCPPPPPPPPGTGTILVDLTMAVLGIGRPPASLTVYLDGVPLPAAVGGRTTLTTTLGPHEVRLGVPGGCGLGFLDGPRSPNPQTVTLTPAAPTGQAEFHVYCIWP
jgi:hypothetical protein